MLADHAFRKCCEICRENELKKLLEQTKALVEKSSAPTETPTRTYAAVPNVGRPTRQRAGKRTSNRGRNVPHPYQQRASNEDDYDRIIREGAEVTMRRYQNFAQRMLADSTRNRENWRVFERRMQDVVVSQFGDAWLGPTAPNWNGPSSSSMPPPSNFGDQRRY